MNSLSLFLICAVAAISGAAGVSASRQLQTAVAVPNFEMHVGGVRVETNRVEITPPDPAVGDKGAANGWDPIVVHVTFDKPFFTEPFIMLDLEHYVVEDGPVCWDYSLHDATDEGFDLHFDHPCGWEAFKAGVRYTAFGN